MSLIGAAGPRKPAKAPRACSMEEDRLCEWCLEYIDGPYVVDEDNAEFYHPECFVERSEEDLKEAS